MARERLFLGALPTDMELKKLNEKWPAPEPGLVIPYEEISLVIGVDAKKSRFMSVIQRWRRQFFKDLWLALPGDGTVKFLTEPERVEQVGREVVSLGKKARRTAVHASVISMGKLDEPTRGKAEGYQRAAAAVFLKMSEEMKALRAALQPPKQLPRGSRAG